MLKWIDKLCGPRPILTRTDSLYTTCAHIDDTNVWNNINITKVFLQRIISSIRIRFLSWKQSAAETLSPQMPISPVKLRKKWPNLEQISASLEPIFFSRVTIEQCQKKVCTKIKERKGGNQAIIWQGVKFAICPKLKSCEMATAANC